MTDIRIDCARGYRAIHPDGADCPEEEAGAIFHPNGIGQMRFDLSDGTVDIYVPGADLVRFLKAYALFGTEAIVPYTEEALKGAPAQKEAE